MMRASRHLRSQMATGAVQEFGAIAQLGERLHGMQEVGGSIPPSSTKYPSGQFSGRSKNPQRCGFFYGLPSMAATLRVVADATLKMIPGHFLCPFHSPQTDSRTVYTSPSPIQWCIAAQITDRGRDRVSARSIASVSIASSSISAMSRFSTASRHCFHSVVSCSSLRTG